MKSFATGTSELDAINSELARLFHCEPLDLSLGADRAMVDELVICGILGGKDVGKTTIINTLATIRISHDSTEVGRGTQRPLAYVHREVADIATARLKATAAGMDVDIVTHTADPIRNAVLLDLPDFDSEFRDHLEMVQQLAPLLDRILWVQTPRKIGDRAWAEMFRRVIKDPTNVSCVLNKFDELLADGGLNGQGTARDHDAMAASFWQVQADWVTKSLAASDCHFNADRMFLIAAAFADRTRFVDEIARRWDDPDWSKYGDDRAGVEAIADRASEEVSRLRERLLDPISSEQAAAIKSANRTFENKIAIERLDEHFSLRKTIHALEDSLCSDYLQGVMHESAGPTYTEAVAAHLATHLRRQTELADELLERRIEHWPLLRLTYWPLGFLSRAAGRRLGERTPRGPQAVADPFLVDGLDLADRADLMRARVLADHAATASRLRLADDMPEGVALARSAGAASQNLVPRFESQLLGGISARDRRPSVIAKLFLWIVLLWFPLLQPLSQGLLEIYLQDGTIAFAQGLYRIVSALSAVHLLSGLAVVAVIFVALLAAMYARALRAVRAVLGDVDKSGVRTLNDAVEALVADQVLLPLLEPIRVRLTTLSELRSAMQALASR